MGGPSPFGGPASMGGPSPFGSPASSTSGGQSPFGVGPDTFGNNSLNNKNNTDIGIGSPNSGVGTAESFNVDDLVKKIDAKIAELEAEEKREKEEAEKKKQAQAAIQGELDNKDDKKLYEEGTFGDDFFNDFFSDE